MTTLSPAFSVLRTDELLSIVLSHSEDGGRNALARTCRATFYRSVAFLWKSVDCLPTLAKTLAPLFVESEYNGVSVLVCVRVFD